MKQATTVAVAAALVFMFAVPTVHADSTEKEPNFEYFVDALGPEFEAHLDDLGVLETPDGKETMTGAEFAELLADRADAAGLNLEDLGTGTTTHGTFPQAGSFITLLEFAVGSTGSTPTCSQGGGGTGGHYDNAEATPAESHTVIGDSADVFHDTDPGPFAAASASAGAGAHVWDFVGNATSSISTAGSGFLFHLEPGASAFAGTSPTGFAGASVAGDAFTYSTTVEYQGTSDFWCVNFSFFGLTITVNFPFLGGAVQEA